MAHLPAAPANLPLRPPLKWAGGKRWLAPQLREYWEQFPDRRLVEPFCGGLAVTLHLMPGQALLNDINPHAINLYRWIRRGLSITLPFTNDAEGYYSFRDRFNRLIQVGKADTQEAAQLFYYLNRTGFNGLCRFNASNGFNVPFGRYKQIRYAQDFLAYRGTFSRWQFRTGDFETIPLREDDFIYADPPYDVEFRQYSKEGFAWEDQERLVRWLVKHPGPVILSNQATDRVVDLYQRHGFDILYKSAPRLISCNGDRTPALEVLATRNLRGLSPRR